jgi:dTDP-4-amino-4,6-dideoxygalactose transaminase
MEPIPFNRPFSTGSEPAAMQQALGNGHVSGDGPFTRRASDMLRELTGARHVLLTTSCTHALEMQARLLDLGPGDEVVMPSFTFVSTANAFALTGATPVFIDIRADTFNLDERLLEAAITPRTKAIVVVHYAGVGADMPAITEIAARRGVAVLEDAAHALGARLHGAPLGAVGSMGTLSFHETKNIHCGEGGALLLRDDDYYERAEILREKGTNRSRFFRGQVDKYTWVDVGSSYLPSDLLAAFLCSQLESFDDIQARRHHVWAAYRDGLEGWAKDRGYAFQHVPKSCEHPAHLFAMLLHDIDERDRFIAYMSSQGVKCVFHYVPLHTAPAYGRFQRDVPSLPVTDDVSSRLVRLPLYPDLDDAMVARIIDTARRFPG